jgi:pyruvate/2-oxoglutarate/acetoin dehydrogenase E1 component
MAITYLEAIREAQAKALADDDSVYIYGQDVAAFGGAFKATKNLAERFPGRVTDAPISEDAMVGSAIGAAIEGMRPIVEMQFADFSSVAFNQIVNQAATHFFRTGVPLPLVVRLQGDAAPACRAVVRSAPYCRTLAAMTAAGLQPGHTAAACSSCSFGICLKVCRSRKIPNAEAI